jgi:hypothetical protein
MPEQEPDRIAFQVTADAVPRETMYLRCDTRVALCCQKCLEEQARLGEETA